jgi:hypothetical protein
MKANELRIGNLLYLNNPEFWENYLNLVVQVDGIDNNMTKKEKEYWKNSFGSLKLICGNLEFHQFSEFAKPIPLTEEWLLKFGFKHIKDNWYNLFANSNTFNVYLFSEIGFRVEIVNQSIAVLNNVHELQNLYFALTNEELKINL